MSGGERSRSQCTRALGGSKRRGGRRRRRRRRRLLQLERGRVGVLKRQLDRRRRAPQRCRGEHQKQRRGGGRRQRGLGVGAQPARGGRAAPPRGLRLVVCGQRDGRHHGGRVRRERVLKIAQRRRGRARVEHDHARRGHHDEAVRKRRQLGGVRDGDGEPGRVGQGRQRRECVAGAPHAVHALQARQAGHQRVPVERQPLQQRQRQRGVARRVEEGGAADGGGRRQPGGARVSAVLLTPRVGRGCTASTATVAVTHTRRLTTRRVVVVQQRHAVGRRHHEAHWVAGAAAAARKADAVPAPSSGGGRLRRVGARQQPDHVRQRVYAREGGAAAGGRARARRGRLAPRGLPPGGGGGGGGRAAWQRLRRIPEFAADRLVARRSRRRLATVPSDEAQRAGSVAGRRRTRIASGGTTGASGPLPLVQAALFADDGCAGKGRAGCSGADAVATCGRRPQVHVRGPVHACEAHHVQGAQANTEQRRGRQSRGAAGGAWRNSADPAVRAHGRACGCGRERGWLRQLLWLRSL